MINKFNDRLPPISRRDFLKQMSLIGVGLGLPAVSQAVIEAADNVAALVEGEVIATPVEAIAVPPLREDGFEGVDVWWNPGGNLIIDDQQVVHWHRMDISTNYDELEFSLEGPVGRPMLRTVTLDFITLEPIKPMPDWGDEWGPFSITVYPNETNYVFMADAVRLDVPFYMHDVLDNARFNPPRFNSVPVNQYHYTLVAESGFGGGLL